MDFRTGFTALKLINRQRGASLYDISDELGITTRYARDVVDELSCMFTVYGEVGGDFAYPRRKIYYLLNSESLVG